MFDPNHILTCPKYRHEQLLLEAAWRYQLIAPLMSSSLDTRQKSQLRRELTTRPQPHPWRGTVPVSARSLRRWCQQYRREHLKGITLKPRRDLGLCRLPGKSLERAKQLHLEDPKRSVTTLLRLLGAENAAWSSLKRTTLGRHLRAAGLSCRDSEAKSYTKFEAEEPNQLWQGDVLHGPVVLFNDKRVTAKVVCWIDDHSRNVVHLQAFANERLPVLEETLTRAISKHGKPLAVLVDNGKIYSCQAFTLACSQLEIQKIHAAPYHPQTKGKQERFFRTLRSQLLGEIEHVAPLPLERFNHLLQCWLDVYHQAVHSSIKMAPSQRFQGAPFRPASRELLEEAFLQWALRKVSTQGVVEFAGQKYHADPGLAGRQVIVRFNPFDLSRIVLWREGRRLGIATPETLLKSTLARPWKAKEGKGSDSSQRYLESLERAQQRNLATELNLIRLEDTNV